MANSPGFLLAAVLVSHMVLGAEVPQSPMALASPPAPLIPLNPTWSFMGNGGPLTLPGRCEIGMDSLKSPEMPLYSIRCTSTVLPSFAGARMNFDVEPYRGKRVRVSAALMTSDVGSVANAQYPNVQGEVGLWIGVGTPRDGLRSDRMQNRTIKGTTGWKTHDFVVDIPEDARQLQAGFWMQGKGQMWMRDLAVEQVPTTVPVNFERNAPNSVAALDLSLAAATAPRPNDRFLPPPQKWLALGEQNFELCDTGIDAKMLTAGQRNLSIACQVPARAYLRQAFEARPWWGKRVRLSAWIRTESVVPRSEGNGQSGAAMYLSATGSNSPIYNAVVNGTTEWTYHELVIDVPTGAPYIPIGLSLVGTGQVWARDLNFEEVSRDTPVTPPPAAVR